MRTHLFQNKSLMSALFVSSSQFYFLYRTFETLYKNGVLLSKLNRIDPIGGVFTHFLSASPEQSIGVFGFPGSSSKC